MKKVSFVVLTITALMATTSAYASKIMSTEDAVKELLGKAVAGKEVSVDKDKVKAKVGKGILVTGKYMVYNAGSKSAIEVAQPGKWGDVCFVVALDNASGKVSGVIVTDSSEKRGKPVTEKKFLNQFNGKGSADAIEVDKDIEGVSGATVSSKAAVHAVKLAVAVGEAIK